ncbi:MAG TPA: M56 family metallopeptidase [Terracidiphilus sp.]|jgi:beta-lactamase regulating signal transducer with metallopeptidase domain|nr:M56 family metallopeptidase [Terracidiphilus sp.]
MSYTLDALAWTLIHFCWQAAAVAVVYRIASLVLARGRSEMRYALSLAALLLMVGGALGTFAWEMRSATSSPALPNIAAEMKSVALRAALQQKATPGKQVVGLVSDVSSSMNLLRWIDGLWVLGVGVLSMRSIGGWWLIQRLRATAVDEAPEALQASFARIAVALGIRRETLLRISSAVAGPITIGALRTMVLLPLSSLTLLGPEELEMVLAHELAHVRRADFLCNIAQTLVETLFFFHPAVWWIGKQIRHERELCCDDLALKICPNPVTYATALFRLEEQRARQWRLAMALNGNQSHQTLRLRIARILGEPVSHGGGRAVQPFSLVVACVALAASLVAAPPVVASFRPAMHGPIRHAAAQSAAATASTAVRPVTASVMHMALHNALGQASATASQKPSDELVQPHSSYIERMKAAGYDVDLDKYIAMKIQDVTPEFAQAMGQAGFGKLSADQLIACKIHGVTPEYIAQLKQQGFEIKGVQDAISFRIFEVTPEFVAGMKSAGFANLTDQQLLSLRVQGVTPEYAQGIAREFPGVTVEDVIKTRIFHIDSAFIESAKKLGFGDLSLDKLVKLRISGILDDEPVKQ